MYLDDAKTLCGSLAQKWGVPSDIHPEDFIFQFLWEHPIFADKEKAVEYYFDDGANSARQLSELLTEVCEYDKESPFDLLEFASGYGCVTRHLRNAIPLGSVTACDIHPQAVDFIQNRLGVRAVLSAHQPEKLDLKTIYDVVFALSFFSHMPKRTFSRWLRKLASLVEPNGYLIFTTHGLVTRRKNAQRFLFDRDGFHFEEGSEQKDLNPDEYGTTIVLPRFVFTEIAKLPHLSLVYFREGCWWEHQDLFILRSLPATLTSPRALYRFAKRVKRRAGLSD